MNQEALPLPEEDRRAETDVFGVDIGIRGAIVRVSQDGNVIGVSRLPVKERAGTTGIRPIMKGRKKRTPSLLKQLDSARLFVDLESELAICDVQIAYVELPPMVSDNMRMTIGSLQHSTGIMDAVLSVLGIRIEWVRPQQWKSRYGLIKSKKRQSVETAIALMPELRGLLVGDADVAEAALVARYGINYIGGK